MALMAEGRGREGPTDGGEVRETVPTGVGSAVLCPSQPPTPLVWVPGEEGRTDAETGSRRQHGRSRWGADTEDRTEDRQVTSSLSPGAARKLFCWAPHPSTPRGAVVLPAQCPGGAINRLWVGQAGPRPPPAPSLWVKHAKRQSLLPLPTGVAGERLICNPTYNEHRKG